MDGTKLERSTHPGKVEPEPCHTIDIVPARYAVLTGYLAICRISLIPNIVVGTKVLSQNFDYNTIRVLCLSCKFLVFIFSYF